MKADKKVLAENRLEQVSISLKQSANIKRDKNSQNEIYELVSFIISESFLIMPFFLNFNDITIIGMILLRMITNLAQVYIAEKIMLFIKEQKQKKCSKIKELVSSLLDLSHSTLGYFLNSNRAVEIPYLLLNLLLFFSIGLLIYFVRKPVKDKELHSVEREITTEEKHK